MNARPIKPMVIAAILGAAIGWMSASLTRDDWEGFIYPNRYDLTKHISIGHFQTIEECGATIQIMLTDLGMSDHSDYECGLNCKASDPFPKVCTETSK